MGLIETILQPFRRAGKFISRPSVPITDTQGRAIFAQFPTDELFSKQLAAITQKVEPADVVAAHESCRSGDAGRLFSAMQKAYKHDDVIRTSLEKRTLNISNKPVRLLPKDKTLEAQRQMEFVQGVIDGLDFNRYVRRLHNAGTYYGVGAIENHWRYDGAVVTSNGTYKSGGFKISGFGNIDEEFGIQDKDTVDPMRLEFGDAGRFHDRIWMRVSAAEYVLINEPKLQRLGKMTLHTPNLFSTGLPHPCDSIGYTTTLYYATKWMLVRDMLRYMRDYGRGGMIVKYSSNSATNNTAEQRQAAENIARQMTTNLGAAIPDDMLVEPLQIAVSGQADAHLKVAMYFDEGISRVILGQSDTTMSPKYSTQGGMDVKQEQQDDVIAYDALTLEAAIFQCFVKPLIDQNFSEPMYPYFDIVSEPPKNRLVELQAVAAMQMVGIPVSEEKTMDELGLVAPKEGEKLLMLPGQAQVAGMMATGSVPSTEAQAASAIKTIGEDAAVA